MRFPVLFAVAMAFPTIAGAAEICVKNATEDRLLFLAEGAERVLSWLDPGGELCTGEATKGNSRIGVFYDEDAQEGCTRLTRAGQVETLVGFHDFDNCDWAETPRGF